MFLCAFYTTSKFAIDNQMILNFEVVISETSAVAYWETMWFKKFIFKKEKKNQ
jgi:hypothetical protein